MHISRQSIASLAFAALAGAVALPQAAAQPDEGWFTKRGFLPPAIDPAKVALQTINPPQKFWDTINTRCVVAGALTLRLGDGVVLDNRALYAVRLSPERECQLQEVFSLTPQDPSTAKELVGALSAQFPPLGLALAGRNPYIVGAPGVNVVVPRVGVAVPAEIVISFNLLRGLAGVLGGAQPPVAAANCTWQGPDADGDGVPDAVEQAGVTDVDGRLFKMDWQKSDSDDDGLTDAEETGQPLTLAEARQRAAERRLDPDTLKPGTCYYDVKSDPLDRDTDGDVIPDGQELDEGTEPRNPDTDGDGLNDGGEKLWGTNPFNRDTDGDGFNDFSEVMAQGKGFNPRQPDQRLSAATFGLEALKGAGCGDICDIDTVPQLVGAIMVGAVPGVGTVADVRDTIANVAKHDFVSASFSALGMVPVGGDVAKALGQVTRYAAKGPQRALEAFRAVANADYLPAPLKKDLALGFLEATAKESKFSLLVRHGVGEETLLRLMKGGQREFDHLAKMLDECGGCIRRDVAGVGSKGWMSTYIDAEKFFRGDALRPKALPPQPRARTDVRFYDALVGDTAIEAKTGYVAADSRILRQIEKDCGMVKRASETVARVEWHFFASGQSSSIGAAPEVINALKSCKNGPIKYIVHMP